MNIIGELKYSSLKKGIGYLKLQCTKSDINYLLRKVEDILKVSIKGDNAHVSIIRDELIPFTKYWYKHKEPIEIKILDDEIFNDGHFYWVDVSCHYIDLIREELGLKRKTQIPLHLTLGYKINRVNTNIDNYYSK